MNPVADLILGVDVGMTYTKVAFVTKALGTNNVQEFKSWPGKSLSHARVVPSKLAYDLDCLDGKPVAWGFECDSISSQEIKVEELFKLARDQDGQSPDRVTKLNTDYMACLYRTFQNYFTLEDLGGKNWQHAAIKFLFSVPATWATTNFADIFKAMALDAGFGEHPNHQVSIALTEPQAVGAYSLSGEAVLQNGQTMLIVDAGGGTLDLCLLRADKTQKGGVAATELAPVSGDEIGSTFIDREFRKLVEKRLEDVKDLVNTDVSDLKSIALHMSNDPTFQAHKYEVGNRRSGGDNTVRVRIPNMKRPITDHDLLIQRGIMVFDSTQIENLFEKQLHAMTKKIGSLLNDYQIGDFLSDTPPGKPVDFVILSGGLGSSPYIRERLKIWLSETEHPMLKGTTFVPSNNPQLAVSRGLVEYARQEIPMFAQFCSQASFGVACSVPYNKRWRLDERAKKRRETAKAEKKITVDDFGQKWMEDCIDWFVLRGRRIREGHRHTHKYTMSFHPDIPAEERRCRIQIVSSIDPNPPLFKGAGNLRTPEVMDVDLSRVPEKIVDASILKQLMGKKPYIRVQFGIETIIGAAEVRFRCYNPSNSAETLSKPVRLKMDLGDFLDGQAPLLKG